jgi:hypothetical protein
MDTSHPADAPAHLLDSITAAASGTLHRPPSRAMTAVSVAHLDTVIASAS